MNLSKNLSEFNRRMVEEVRGTFAPDVEPYQTEDRTLVFRGPIQGHSDPKHIGTHVAVSLDAEVCRTMDAASPSEREDMIQIYLANLGSRVKIEYDPKNIGPYAIDVVGTMRTLKGWAREL